MPLRNDVFPGDLPLRAGVWNRYHMRVSPSVWLHPDTCNVYLIVTGTDAVAIDFGSGAVLDHLADYGVARITDVLMTHHHRDQGQGLARAAEAGARIWVPSSERHL